MHKLGKQMAEHFYGNPVKETAKRHVAGSRIPFQQPHIFYIDTALFADTAQGIYALGCSKDHHFEQDLGRYLRISAFNRVKML